VIDLNVEGLQQFIPQLLSKVHVECLIHGNVTVTEATDILKLIESKLTTEVPNIIPLLEQQLILPREIKIENGKHVTWPNFIHDNLKKINMLMPITLTLL